MEIDFSGKTALVTGAGKAIDSSEDICLIHDLTSLGGSFGIGRATVKLLAKCGANIVALSRTKSDLDSLKAEVPTKFTPVIADLMKLDEAVKAIEATGEHIDLLVNNAGLVVLKETIDVTEEDIDRSMIINVKAPIRLSQLVARDLIRRGTGGAIVNVSTVLTQIAPACQIPYTMTKAAMDNATMAMAVELAKHKIRVNSVLPGLVDTPHGSQYPPEIVQMVLKRYPRGQRAGADEVADSIVYLLSDRASNITGTKIVTDGGMLAN